MQNLLKEEEALVEELEEKLFIQNEKNLSNKACLEHEGGKLKQSFEKLQVLTNELEIVENQLYHLRQEKVEKETRKKELEEDNSDLLSNIETEGK